MLNNLKALIVVLSISITVFLIAKPLCLRFMAEHDFTRRRNIWITLTITAFVSPSFWLYVMIAMPVLVWGARRDQNPLALYALVLFVIPPVGFQIPTIVINQLFELDTFRILSFAILFPAAWRLRQQVPRGDFPKFAAIDRLILAYVVLQLVLLMPHESITNTMRRGFLLSIDMLLVYYVASRTATSRSALADLMASFCLLCAILAPIALFETLRGWLLYVDLRTQWGEILPSWSPYLRRGDSLRAQASTGHALTLASMITFGFGFWLYLSSKIRSNSQKVIVAIGFLMALYVTFSRAPMLAAVMIFFIYLALGPKGYGRLFTALLASGLIAIAIALSPAGDRFVKLLPFVGTDTDPTIDYRIRLAEISWNLILQNPVFGNPYFLTYMEDLRQGQGIIDLLNHYANVGLLYGFAGLTLFIAPLLIALRRAYVQLKRSTTADPDLALLGASLMACFLTLLTLIASQGIGRGQVFYLIAGLVAGFAQIKLAPAAVGAHQASSPVAPRQATHPGHTDRARF